MKILFISLFFSIMTAQLNAQNNYEYLFATEDDDRIEFIYHDHIENKQIILYTRDCKFSDTNCISQRLIYEINSMGDTIKLPYVDNRNDTLLSINHLIRELNGDYFLTGLAWIPDSNSFLWIESDYCMKWDSDYNIIWESIHARPSPSPIDSLSRSSNFKILKLLNGNCLIVKSIFTLEPNVAIRYYLTEISSQNGSVVKEKISHIINGYVQGLTYNHDSSSILVHLDHVWMNECNRSSCGVFILDTASFDTTSSYCYNRDDDDPYKYWCVHVPYNALLKNNGNLILSGTGDCSNLYGPGEDYLFIYEYDTAFQLINRTFYTDKDTLYDAGWYESMAFNDSNEILFAGNHDRMPGPYSSHYNYIYIAKVDSNLDLMCERYIGGDAEYIVHSMDATNDGGMVVSGTRYDYLVNNDEHDAFVIKTDANLWVKIQENSKIEIHSAIVYPNPGTNQLVIRTTEYPSTFELYDIQGNFLIKRQIDDHISTITTEFLKNGIYIWTLVQDNLQIDKGKWIKKTN